MAKYKLHGTNGQLYVYDNHIVIERKGILGAVSHPTSRRTELSFSEIENVIVKHGNPAYNGYIYFKIDTRKINIFKSVYDENSIVFRFFHNDLADEICDYVYERI